MIKKYTLKNDLLEVTILNLGGIIHEIKMPDSQGNVENIIHGFDNIEDYKDNNAYFGALIGRTAGRINKGQYSINGNTYAMACNDRGNGLHGGLNGLDKKLWQAKQEGNCLCLEYRSEDGEEGFPGNVDIKVVYELMEDKLVLNYYAQSDQDTLMNMTNHSYFNLDPKKSILDMTLELASDQLIAINETSIPTGELMDVTGTPFDFRKAKKIGQDINGSHKQLELGGGYDHPWLLRGSLKLSADNGRQMIVTTNQPCVVLYSYNYPIEGHEKYQGLAVECQAEPNGINQVGFNDSILRVGETYHQETVYQFKVD